MALHIPLDKMTVPEVREELESDFTRWDSIAAEGCSDPLWPDGVNMNLVRNHIIADYRILHEKLAAQTQMSLFEDEEQADERPVPPKVPDNYMSPTGKYPDRLISSSWPVLTHDMKM